jgi:hypothetical protein
MKLYGGWMYNPYFLDLGASWSWVLSFTPLPFHPQGKNPSTHWIRGWVGPRAQFSAEGTFSNMDYRAGSTWFESRLGRRVSWLRLFWFSSVSPVKYRYRPRLSHNRLLLSSFQFIIHQSLYHLTLWSDILTAPWNAAPLKTVDCVCAYNYFSFNSSVFLDIKPWSLLKINKRFGGTYRLHLHGWIISQARHQSERGRSRGWYVLLKLYEESSVALTPEPVKEE